MLTLDAGWFEQDDCRGYVLKAEKAWLLEHSGFVTWVAGVNHFSDAAQHQSFQPGRRLQLQPEPENPVDPDAIAVWNIDGTLQAGYLPRIVNENLPSKSEQRYAVATTEELDGDLRIGLGMLVSQQPVELRSVTLDESVTRRKVRTIPKARRYAPDPAMDPVDAMHAMLGESKVRPARKGP